MRPSSDLGAQHHARHAQGDPQSRLGWGHPACGLHRRDGVGVVAGRLLATQTMKARSLIDGASYGPDALKAIGRAFDEAWAQIAGNFGSDPVVIEAARLKLANALLSVADDDSRDVEVLRQAALQRMALDYRTLRATDR